MLERDGLVEDETRVDGSTEHHERLSINVSVNDAEGSSTSMFFIGSGDVMGGMDAFFNYIGARSPRPRAVSILSIFRSGVVA